MRKLLIRTLLIMVLLIIRSKKYVRHSLHVNSVPLGCSKMLLELLGLYWAGDLIVLLFCAWWVLSGIHICHKPKLTHYIWMKSGTQMAKVHKSIFPQRHRWLCLDFYRCHMKHLLATCSKELPGMDMPWWAEVWEPPFCFLRLWFGWG